MNPVRVAIVGCGRISDLHELGYRNRDDARITAVYDIDKKRALSQAKAWAVDKVYSSYEEVLSDREIDLIELLVPHHVHADMTVKACRAGKHVSVQKPIALNVAETDSMIEAAYRAGVVLRIYENFVFYPPYVRAKEMIEAGEIGEPQMIRLHVNSGTNETGWQVPESSWAWRFNEKVSGGGELVFDHGYHLFSLARYLMGEVKRVCAWIDRSPDASGFTIDAPATIMFQFKSPRRYGVLDIAHTPKMRIDSLYYTDDDRIEVIGEKGILFVNRCTAKTVDLPAVMMFRDGITTTIPVERVEWHESFIDCTRHLIHVLRNGGQPLLDGPAARKVLQ
ncbi:MAG: Gfo/Idh/MocA family oxidoreductase, partial [Spirochaetales bacterium]|nr:Gfo/Idh/MocA family oxidoreductase [Spirochaetales bacterium]